MKKRITKGEWYRISLKLADSVTDCFNAKEIIIIEDFIETAKNDVDKVQR